MSLYDSLTRWNLWGRWQIPTSFMREDTAEIARCIDTEEVIALIGPRRAGKSTILYQLMQHLLDTGIPPQALLHINFEEPGLSPRLQPGLLDELYDTYRARVYPKGKAFIFLDEVQNLPEWERWVRARNDTEDIKIFITGSSSSLLSGELATVLSGRNFCFEIYPLSFREVLQFKNIALPQTPYPDAAPAEIQFALHEYLQWGGFPRVVLAKSDEERQRILRRYFDEILFKDIVQRHEIRNVVALRNVAIHLLTNTSTRFTYKRIADVFGISSELAQTYIGYLEDAFIISTLDFFSLKASERTRNPLKVHAIDLGLRYITSISASADETKLIETQVFNTLLRHQTDTLYYWKDGGEIDVLTHNGIDVTQLCQVAYAGLEKETVAKREFGNLQKAMTVFPKAKPLIVTWALTDDTITQQYPDIPVIPLWQFLLECGVNNTA